MSWGKKCSHKFSIKCYLYSWIWILCTRRRAISTASAY
jgi:hypothetical protein